MNRRGFLGSLVAAVVAGPSAVGALLERHKARFAYTRLVQTTQTDLNAVWRKAQQNAREAFDSRTEPWELAEELKDEEFDYWTKYEMEKFGGVLGL